MDLILLASVFVVATCGLAYELISGTLASYLLGDSVTQFSTIIGTYLFAMGVGSYASRFVHRNHLKLFIETEILVALLGGCAAAGLFVLFEYIAWFRLALYFLVFTIGFLVGLEIPLLMNVLKDQMQFKDLVSKVLSFDYVGALVASLLFPLILLPHLGLVRSGFFFGILNALVALWVLLRLGHAIGQSRRYLLIGCISTLVILTVGFALSERIVSFAETNSYAEPVIYSKTTPYQHVVVTRGNDSLKLYLNKNLQFDSRDEYRYHEALVHIGLANLAQRRRVLILGGGDGLAAREVLRYPDVEQVTLVDLDPTITDLFTEVDFLSELNGGSLKSKRVKIVNADAFIWLREQSDKYDFVIIDFPDPSSFAIGKLYSTKFYHELARILSDAGRAVVQGTSPFFARQSFWCIDATLRASGFKTSPYHTYLPSFGEWGFILASRNELLVAREFPSDLKFLTPGIVDSLLSFPKDMSPIDVEVNKLNNQMLVHYYEREWARYTG